MYVLYRGSKDHLEMGAAPSLLAVLFDISPYPQSLLLSLLSLFLSPMAPSTYSMSLLLALVSLGQAERLAKWTPLSRKEEGVKTSVPAESLPCPIFVALYLEVYFTLPHS